LHSAMNAVSIEATRIIINTHAVRFSNFQRRREWTWIHTLVCAGFMIERHRANSGASAATIWRQDRVGRSVITPFQFVIIAATSDRESNRNSSARSILRSIKPFGAEGVSNDIIHTVPLRAAG